LGDARISAPVRTTAFDARASRDDVAEQSRRAACLSPPSFLRLAAVAAPRIGVAAFQGIGRIVAEKMLAFGRADRRFRAIHSRGAIAIGAPTPMAARPCKLEVAPPSPSDRRRDRR